jgi:hypothetical protein
VTSDLVVIGGWAGALAPARWLLMISVNEDRCPAEPSCSPGAKRVLARRGPFDGSAEAGERSERKPGAERPRDAVHELLRP